VEGSSPAASSSLLGVTIRRAVASGRFYLVYGTAMTALLGTALALTSPSTFATSFALFLPIFGVAASIGGLVVFTGDRAKGVLEYLLAYGVSPRRLFANVLLTAVSLSAIVFAIGGGVGVGVYLARGNPFTPELGELLFLYGVPMGFASAAFAATVGVYWSALSSPRAGMNSPVGVIPLIGILPPLATVLAFSALGIAGELTVANALRVIALSLVLVGGTVLLLLRFMDRLLKRERFLSPA
jgi:hypothetical protein